MTLPDVDESYLTIKGFKWEIISGTSDGYLVLKQIPLNPSVYDRSSTDLMIRLPGQYPLAALDMFYVTPELKLVTGGLPPSADVFEEHAGLRWQRFSRHLAAPWRPGIDGLAMFLALILPELQKGRE